jgi:SOS response regulatory protein OraA/RecX
VGDTAKEIQVGNYQFSKRRWRVVCKFVAASYNIHPKEEGFEQTITDNIDEILWFYEGEYIYSRCLRLLSIRPRSRKEIADFLDKHVGNDRSKQLIFDRLGIFLNDEEFADFIVRKERSHNPKGDRVIRMKLQDKGIDEEIIAHALASESDVQELIAVQYEKKKKWFSDRIARKGSDHPKRDFDIKMKQYLISKGFSLSDIDQFLKAIPE